jgi:hypothetical protein
LREKPVGADLVVKAGPIHGYPRLVGLEYVLHSHGGNVDNDEADIPDKKMTIHVIRTQGVGLLNLFRFITQMKAEKGTPPVHIFYTGINFLAPFIAILRSVNE